MRETWWRGEEDRSRWEQERDKLRENLVEGRRGGGKRKEGRWG